MLLVLQICEEKLTVFLIPLKILLLTVLFSSSLGTKVTLSKVLFVTSAPVEYFISAFSILAEDLKSFRGTLMTIQVATGTVPEFALKRRAKSWILSRIYYSG